MNKASPYEGILLFFAALLLFACMDTTTKYLAASYNVPLIVAVRYITHALLMLVLLAPRHGRKMIQTKRTGLVMLRGASLAVSSLFMGLALQRMPVAETTAIVFLGPIIVVLLAVPFLGERLTRFSWVAAVIGFIGVLLIARPGNTLDWLGTLFAFCVVCALVVYQLLSRVLVKTEETIPLLFYTAMIGATVYGCLLPWTWYGPAPDTKDILLFLSMGVSGGLGHFLYTAAYRHAPASVLAPMNYLQLLWAGLLGWMVFAHIPDTLSIVGMAVIIVSGAIIALQSRPVKHQESVDDHAV
jgi:drug/metabolite transporter (DMT)-like permease